ncbi:glycosyltransferase [Roseiconus lacunae]|uniref:glycosyltransferase family 2 protein n=1 Tax=Roseiconus lacunae TaxID=2605694 RepID=UPI003091920E|nr:glycosyltransferase [Stieleria sp. HD01]
MANQFSSLISIVIPTYGRDAVLIQTICSLLELAHPANEILIVDQSMTHDEPTERQLSEWAHGQTIRWIRRRSPSITAAMNDGLRQARSKLVLFLDDDIKPRSELVRIHRDAHVSDENLWATVGQIVQPWQSPEDRPAPKKLSGLRVDEDFPFHSSRNSSLQNVMAGNLCVKRHHAIALGGFDENFIGSAFRFETEFAHRLTKAGGLIRFLGDAGIDHLRADHGGTRDKGSHLTSMDPRHGIGDHYFALLHSPSPLSAYVYCARRTLREIRTKFHLHHPWWIPAKLIGECRAFLGALRLLRRKRKHLTPASDSRAIDVQRSLAKPPHADSDIRSPRSSSRIA